MLPYPVFPFFYGEYKIALFLISNKNIMLFSASNLFQSVGFKHPFK